MKHPIPDHNPMRGQFREQACQTPRHFACTVRDGVATVTLNRPERKNPLTFDAYGELRDWFRTLPCATDIHAMVLRGAGDNFCSGGGVHEIIGPLTRMTGDVVKAMRARTAYLFTRVGLADTDMGACALPPRVIGQGRAMTAQEALTWGFFDALHAPEALHAAAQTLAGELATGPTFAHGMTKTMLHQEWAMPLDQAIEAQAICMQTQDFRRAYEAFVTKQRPVFEGD